MNKIKHLFLILFIVISHVTLSQVDKTYDYLPPSPTASELGRYGLGPINLSTGAMSTSVPIYTLKTANFTIPISLNYSSSGVKVDQIASNVGMSWSLDAGGVITRMIRDKDDMEDLTPAPYPSNVNNLEYDLVNYLHNSVDEEFDSERDLYSFNFVNLTGKFVFTRDNIPLIIPYRRIDIQRTRQLEDTDFLITDENGVRYYFNISENTRTVQQGLDCGKNFPDLKETAWYITKIIHPEGDTVHFEYESYGYFYSPSISQTFTEKLNVFIDCLDGTCPTVQEKLCSNLLWTSTARLTRMRTNGYGDAVFHSSSTRSDIPGEYKLDSIEFVLPDNQVTSKWVLEYAFSTNSGFGDSEVTGTGLDSRMFLTRVYQKGTDSPNRKSYSFEYHQMNGLPKRLSFAQDHWGYFNGKSNAHFVPKPGMVALRDDVGSPLFTTIAGNKDPDHNFAGKGLLTKIVYPTGGYDSIEYEGNSYWGSKTIYPSKNYHEESLESHLEVGSEQQIIEVHSSILQDVQFDFSASYLPGAEEDPIHCFGRITITDLTASNTVFENLRVNPGNAISPLLALYAGHDYRITIKTFGNDVVSNVRFDLFEQEPQTVQDNIPTGGMRVSKVTSHVPESGQSYVNKYYYASFNDLTKSSGVIANAQPVYYQFSKSYHVCNGTCDNYECRYVTLNSNSNVNLNGFAGNNIAYPKVIVSQGNQFENGYEEHEFYTSQDNPGSVVYGDEIQGAPYTNIAWDNGLEKIVRKYKKEGASYQKIYELENTYVRDQAVDLFVPNLVVRKKYDFICPVDLVIYCDESNVNTVYREYTCVTTHSHTWLMGGIPLVGNGQTKCIAVGAINQWVTIGYHPCYNKQAEVDSVIMYSQIENIDALEYRDYAHWFYLKSMKETTLTDNGSVLETIKNFDYKDITHLQLTQEHFVTSIGETLTTKYWYPHDFTFGSFADSLKNKNIIARPLKTETYLAKKTISGAITKYNTDGSIAEVWKRNEANPSDSLVHDPTQLVIPPYELEGSITRDFDIKKPREIHYPDGKIATLIWGYGRKYLIAQVMNKSFSEIQVVLGAELTSLENSSDDTYINSKLNVLRTALPDSHITSFNYKPGIGVISQTDQNNITTYYSYDTFGRVATIKDNEGNIVKKYSYNYKHGNPGQ
ncbi:MAG TPA: hypothetical protein VFU05_10425 [Cyclobacteriaceae bacterium]|nr:hypothetical protein [Cyclobacteriaceae bacterium]